MNEKLLLVNAYGPYVHGVWKSKKGKVGNEESLQGRAQTIVETFVQKISSIYSREEISSMTLCDIGCYDGWILCEIEKQLNFKKIVGYEPRKKNIERGKAVRDYLEINTTIEFRQASLEEVAKSGERYDIVLFPGVIHHLEDLPGAINQLINISKRDLFIEGNCFETNSGLSKLLGTKSMQRFKDIINPKDIIYSDEKNKNLQIAIAGFKLESAYYDGSTIGNDLQVVTIASPEYLHMLLHAKGAQDIQILKSPQEYRDSMNRLSLIDSTRFINYRFTMIYAKVSPKTESRNNPTPISRVNSIIEDSEERYLTTLMPKKLINRLNTCGNKSSRPFNLIYKLAIKGNDYQNKIARRIIAKYYSLSLDQKNILDTFFHCPMYKLSLETLKHAIIDLDIDESKKQLHNLLFSESADWRCFYRSLALWLIIENKLCLEDTNQDIAELIKIANPNFPPNLLSKAQQASRPEQYFKSLPEPNKYERYRNRCSQDLD